MPDTTITIDRGQREPLHLLVIQHVSGTGRNCDVAGLPAWT